MSANAIVPQLMTTGRIAQQLGQPVYRVAYVIATRRISESARAGTLRLFDRQAMARIRHELNAMDARRAADE